MSCESALIFCHWVHFLKHDPDRDDLVQSYSVKLILPASDIGIGIRRPQLLRRDAPPWDTATQVGTSSPQSASECVAFCHRGLALRRVLWPASSESNSHDRRTLPSQSASIFEGPSGIRGRFVKLRLCGHHFLIGAKRRSKSKVHKVWFLVHFFSKFLSKNHTEKVMSKN